MVDRKIQERVSWKTEETLFASRCATYASKEKEKDRASREANVRAKKKRGSVKRTQESERGKEKKRSREKVHHKCPFITTVILPAT